MISGISGDLNLLYTKREKIILPNLPSNLNLDAFNKKEKENLYIAILIMR